MSKTYQVQAISEVLSPLTHMKGVEGNESLIAREPVTTPAGIRFVPHISGNAIRHRLVRDPGAWFLVDEWDLAGKLSMSQLNMLFHGGNLTEGGGRENTARISDMERLFPLIRLLGGSLPSQILSGSMLAWRGTLVCEENRDRLGRLVPDGWMTSRRLRPAESFVDSYQYTRGDATKTAASALPPGAYEGPSNLMIFSGQCVLAGAMFVHGFVLQNVSDLELGALLLSLRLWQSRGGTVGGQSARGHGRLKTSLSITPDGADEEAVVGAYVDHVRSVKDEAVAFLNSCFAAPKEAKEPKAKKGGKNAPAESNLLA